MKYSEYQPGEFLKKHIKCYYLFETEDSMHFFDNAFATGSVEIMFNMAGGRWQSMAGGKEYTHPAIELWGQIITPLPFRSMGENTMVGVRFYPHTAALFIDEEMALLNDKVNDLTDIAGKQVKELHEQLVEASGMVQRVALLDAFFIKKLLYSPKKNNHVSIVGAILSEMSPDVGFQQIEKMAADNGISPRYLHKLFLQYTGLGPKLHFKIKRFQASLALVSVAQEPLTAIAYDCGYFDQSHFIKEFKTFTGLTPSAYGTGSSTALWASQSV